MEDLGVLAGQLDDLILSAEKVLDENWGDENPKANRQARILCYRLEAALDRIALPGTVYAIQLADLRTEVLEIKLDEVYSIAVALYNDLQQKSVTAWMGLRNKAAHGDYDAYDDNEVRAVIQGVLPVRGVCGASAGTEERDRAHPSEGCRRSNRRWCGWF